MVFGTTKILKEEVKIILKKVYKNENKRVLKQYPKKKILGGMK